MDTIVEWNLKETDDGTELTLIHSGFTEDNGDIFTGMYDGWNKNIQKMVRYINAQT